MPRRVASWQMRCIHCYNPHRVRAIRSEVWATSRAPAPTTRGDSRALDRKLGHARCEAHCQDRDYGTKDAAPRCALATPRAHSCRPSHFSVRHSKAPHETAHLAPSRTLSARPEALLRRLRQEELACQANQRILEVSMDSERRTD